MSQHQMASAINNPNNTKDPVTYQRLRESFIRDLQHFHDTRGTSFKKFPKVNGKEVDLYKLYTVVTSRGGWIQVNSKNEWAWLCEEFHLPSGCVNSGVGLKQIYLRYLDRYEKVHFLGEDGHQADDDDEDSRHRKWNARSLHSVPLTYNHHQHNVAESLREYNGLSSNLYKPSNYDKLALSLISPLPNEQDFAINVCTFLSNEGKHTLRLDKCPRLVNHLLAHAGIFDSPGTRQLFIEIYSRVRNYSINSFWQDVLDSQDVLDLTDERIFVKKPANPVNQRVARTRHNKDIPKSQAHTDVVNIDDATCPMDLDNGPLDCDRLGSNNIDTLDERLIGSNGQNLLIDEASSSSSSTYKDQNQNSIKFEDDDKDLFCVGRTLGTQDPYGQRVLQIASILRNLSFTPENAVILGRNRCFLRFVLLCVRARWSNLHQLGFDTLGNIANEIVLKEAGERLTSVMLSCVAKGIDSQDRFVVISCLEILNKVSQQDLNEETLSLGLDDGVYELICRFLALSDIALLVYTLECLYALTSLGERPCTSVARVRGAIDTLVALVTVEAQSYGPKACILMRVVETVSSIPASQQSNTQNPTVSQSGPSSNSSSSSSSTTQPQQTLSSNANSSTITVHHTSAAPSTGAPTATSVNMATSNTSSIPSTSHTQTQSLQTVQSTVQPLQVQQTTTVQQAPQSASPKPSSGSGSSRPSTPKGAAAKAAAANSLQQQHAHQQIIQENEQFALGWLRATFELAPGVKIEQEELYKRYLGCCTKIGRRGVIAPPHFPRCVRSVFGGTIGPNPGKGETTGSMYYEGIRLRANPGQITYPSASGTSTNQTGTNSNVVTVVGGTGNPGTNSAKVSVSHPHLSQALLASGAQQAQSSSNHQQQQQQQQVQTVQVIVKDDGRGGTTSSSIIKSLLATKVAQRQQQQQQQRQQLQQQGSVQAGITPTKTLVNAKSKHTIVAVKKVQRLNGAKIIVTNNCEKTETMEIDNGQHVVSSASTTSTETNHVTAVRVCRTNQQQVVFSSSSANKVNQQHQQQRNVVTPVVDDSDSTNNSLASSSGIGGSRDCSGAGGEEENSLTSFEGILLNGAPSNIDIDAQEDGSSKDSSSVGSKEKPLQSMMLADLLERKVDKEPIMNGILGKKDLVENHIKKVLKESPSDTKIKVEVSEDALIEAPPRMGVKRTASSGTEVDESIESKKPKYSNGTTSPDPAVVDSTTVSSIKSEEQDDEKEEKVTVSSTAANLYAALAADIIEDETDLEEPVCVKDETKPVVKEEVIVKDEPLPPVVVTNQFGNQVVLTPEQHRQIRQHIEAHRQQQIQQAQAQIQTPQPQQPQQQQQQIAITQQQQQLQQGLIVAAPRQIVVQQAIQSNNQIVTIPATIKGRQTHQLQPQVLQMQQSPTGQTHYVISGGVPGQNYVLAQPQTALVQGQAQTVLVAQQQGTNTKTIIILQPQSAAQPQPQKMVAVTPQGQQVVVTQVPRPLLQSSAIGSIPPPLVPSSGSLTQASIVVNSAMTQQPQQSQSQSQTASPSGTQNQQSATSNVTSRVATPTPTSTPPTSRPTTPHQGVPPPMVSVTAKPQPSATPPPPSPASTSLAKDTKDSKTVTTSTSTEPETSNGGNSKPSTSQDTPTTRSQTPTPSSMTTASTGNKTITIKIDPNSFLCEWRGCLRQFKTARKVFLHVCETHCPTGSEEALCLWASCDSLKRRRFSLMTHVFDRHCCDDVMLMRRKQLTLCGKTEVTSTVTPTSSHHPGYAPNAALHAIKRHALEFINPKELMDDNEGPVTKSIRLTAALILRNLVIYSAHGRRHLRAYEPHLAGVALSNVESSRTIAQVLYDMNDQSSSGHR